MKVTFLVIVVFLIFNGVIADGFVFYNNDSLSSTIFDTQWSNNASGLIDELTWAFMRYDHVGESDNFGLVHMPKPTPGPVIIPVNMMSRDVCRCAVDIYQNNESEILEGLEAYDLQNVVVGFPYIVWHMWASKHALPCLGQKLSIFEMQLLGKRCFWANLVGDCYSQSLFNTAVLRLCGFSAEEVFTVAIPMHAIVVVQVEGSWLVFDSVKGQFSKNAMSDSYTPPAEEVIYWLENDKYFINFGTPYPEAWPYQEDPYCNINASVLTGILEKIVPLLNNSSLGRRDWGISSFLENASVCPDMVTIGMPYTVEDALGDTADEKAESLVQLNQAFVVNQTGGDPLNQYDRSIYARGDLFVEHPQVYAHAAKLGLWTSCFARHLDACFTYFDLLKTGLWIKFAIKTEIPIPREQVLFSDFVYVSRMGSSVDQALVAYGSLRNMKKDNSFWPYEDLYVIVTNDNSGYLAVNTTYGWRYLRFGIGSMLSSSPPSDIEKAFNEKEYMTDWNP